MSKKTRLGQIMAVIKALTREAQDHLEAADELYDKGRLVESAEQMKAAGELIKLVERAQLVARTLLESHVDDPHMIREAVQEAVAREDLGLQRLEDELAKEDPWWSERST
jgi:hypothetical protein